jgi:hypothetical protein
MQTRASLHRYIVMEAYVTMLSGKYKNLDDTIKKLVDVLTLVMPYFILEIRVSPRHARHCYS